MVVTPKLKLDELIQFVEVASPQAVCDFVNSNYTSENIQREPIEKRIQTFMGWRLRGGFQIEEVTEKSSTSIFANVTSVYTGLIRFF